MRFGTRSGWGLSGSTNSYTNSYTIRATENAIHFSDLLDFQD